jgi:hypothetical protein
MDPAFASDRIAQLEQEIENLNEAAERSRRIIILARGAMALGAGWLVAGFLSILPLDATAIVFSSALLIGGIVFSGSSGSSLEETKEEIRKAEETRGALIDAIDPAEVRELPDAPESNGAGKVIPFARPR